jgi:hypothetical protein
MINISYEAPAAAVANDDECLRVAATPYERLFGAMTKAAAIICLGRFQDGLTELDAQFGV